MVESPLGFAVCFVVCCLLHCCCDDDDGCGVLLPLPLAIGLSVPDEGVWLWVELWEEL